MNITYSREMITVQSNILTHESEREVMLKRIIDLAVKGLANMFDEEKRLFCYRMRQTSDGIVREGVSRRYTIISLIGLHRYEAQGGQSPIDIQATLAVLLEDTEQIDNIGDLGLLLWLCALVSPKQLNKIFHNLDIKRSLEKYSDGRQGKTTELAWFLAGLSHSALASNQKANGQEDLSMQAFSMLKRNFGAKGIFGHMNKSSLAGILRGRIGCFADQVYPIYALSMFAKAYENKEALKIANECAEAICRLQGDLGQWWWHYDSLTGKVIGRCPVYSVHQDGMAPMALFALSEVSGLNFDTHIYKGLKWITGNNELGFDLIDTSQNVIWRSIYSKRYKMYYDEMLTLTGLTGNKRKHNDLRILFECRPYQLGWLLYAFADKQMERAISKAEGLHA